MTARLLYDPDCGFCTAAGGWMRRHLRLRAEVAPLRGDEPGVDAERARREVPFVDAAGSVHYGAPAMAAALATGPAPVALVGRLLGSAVVLRVANPAYAWVAHHRHRLPGGTASCELT
ncbi:MAG TPA: DCC1-like thiol-disulfide oxidoreductase family protein [Quisquiliibacterium sp.]|nr:DCC1-like thiol-disulfide oxidoreductase family protein [Quisquiliibacterium sp.]